jgi:hypothetical protein
MRVALFNGFPYHYEMFGFAIEYLQSRRIPFTIFTEVQGEMGWLALYQSRYGPLDIQHYRSYFSSACDVVFLLTDDDPRFALTGIQPPTVILFEHRATRESRPQFRHRFSLRPVEGRGPESWMLPVWSPAVTKQKTERVHVVVVGYNCPTTPESIRPYIPNLADIQFTFITRRPDPAVIIEDAWAPYAPRILYGVSADQIVAAAAAADWLLVIPKQDYQIRDAISAMVPIAYSVGTPLLMLPEHGETYPFKGIVGLDGSRPLEHPTDAILASVAEERVRLLERRDRLLDVILFQR